MPNFPKLCKRDEIIKLLLQVRYFYFNTKRMSCSIKFMELGIYMMVVFSSASMVSYAQEKFKAGPAFAISYKTVSGLSDTGGGVGYGLGITSQIPLSSRFILAPEILYFWKGLRFCSQHLIQFNWSENSDEKLRLKYVNILIPARCKIQGAFGITAGIEVGYLIAANYELYGRSTTELFYNSSTYISNYSADVTEDFSRYDAGIIIGPSFYFRSGIILSALADMGVLDINENNKMKNNLNYYFKFSCLISSGKRTGK